MADASLSAETCRVISLSMSTSASLAAIIASSVEVASPLVPKGREDDRQVERRVRRAKATLHPNRLAKVLRSLALRGFDLLDRTPRKKTLLQVQTCGTPRPLDQPLDILFDSP